MVEYRKLAAFFDCPVLTFFLDPTPMSNGWTDLHALWFKRRVSAQGFSPLGLERWILAKMGVNGQFQGKTTKYKNHNISETVNRKLAAFFDCPVSILRPCQTAGPIYTLYGSNDVFPRGCTLYSDTLYSDKRYSDTRCSDKPYSDTRYSDT